MSDIETKARFKAITTSDLGRKMPSFAQHLAFETSLSPEEAAGCLAALAEDLSAAPAAPGGDQWSRKETAGTLGLAPIADLAPKGRWADAVAKANTYLGERAV